MVIVCQCQLLVNGLDRSPIRVLNCCTLYCFSSSSYWLFAVGLSNRNWFSAPVSVPHILPPIPHTRWYKFHFSYVFVFISISISCVVVASQAFLNILFDFQFYYSFINIGSCAITMNLNCLKEPLAAQIYPQNTHHKSSTKFDCFRKRGNNFQPS